MKYRERGEREERKGRRHKWERRRKNRKEPREKKCEVQIEPIKTNEKIKAMKSDKLAREVQWLHIDLCHFSKEASYKLTD